MRVAQHGAAAQLMPAMMHADRQPTTNFVWASNIFQYILLGMCMRKHHACGCLYGQRRMRDAQTCRHAGDVILEGSVMHLSTQTDLVQEAGQ